MALTIDAIYSTNTLIAVVPNLKTSQNFLLDTFFPNILEADTEFVTIDVDVGKRRLAPFVSPLVQGRMVEGRGIRSSTYKPAYIKDKRVPDLRRPVRRMIGERLGGTMTGAEREAANIEYEMTDQVDMINRRLEWMAASALRTGTVTVQGDGLPLDLIDFGRDPALTVALTGTARWGQGGTPAANIDGWASTILQKSGYAPTELVFTNTAWNLFLGDQRIRDSILSPGDKPQFAIAGGTKKGAIYKGMWGTYNLWLYNDWYVDPTTETEMPMLPDGTVIVSGGDGLMGTRAFGMIIDPRHDYGPMAYAPKSWIENDPAQRFLMMQSAPLVIPSRVNASFAATVI